MQLQCTDFEKGVLVLGEVTLSKAFRDVCYEIMDGSCESIGKLDAFFDYPHQVMAVKAAVAYFDGDFETGLTLTAINLLIWSL